MNRNNEKIINGKSRESSKVMNFTRMMRTRTYTAQQTSFFLSARCTLNGMLHQSVSQQSGGFASKTLFLSRPGTDPGTQSQMSIRDSMICMEYLQATPGLALAYRQQNRNRSIIHEEFLFDHRIAPLILVPKCPRR